VLRNNVKEIKNNQWETLHSLEDIKGETLNHFERMYITSDVAEWTIGRDVGKNPKLHELGQKWDSYPNYERGRSIESCLGSSSKQYPVPDGFTIHFHHYCRYIIKYDLLQMLKYDHKYCRMGGDINSNFLSIIPKYSNPSSLSHFRPISLCNSSNNILAKIITNMLKLILSKIIYENQGGFVETRKIVDNIILVQEAIHSSKY